MQRLKFSPKFLMVILCSLALAACNQTTQTNLSGKTSLGSQTQIDARDNAIKIAHNKHVAAHGGIDGNFARRTRVSRILKKLIQKNALSNKIYKSVILRSKGINAYSLGSNSRYAYVYVTQNLLNFVENDHQLAAVLAHELSHIQLNHHLLRNNSTGSQFNQKQELEADKYSIKLLKKAGYNPQEVIKMLQNLDVLQAKLKLVNKVDYPSNKQRIFNLATVIAKA